MFDVCGTFFQSEAARRGGRIGGAVAAACLAHGRPPRVGCAHVLPAASPARASASTAQSYPCLPPAFSCAPPPAFPMRPIPAPARVIRTALSLRAAGFVRPPRERRILAGSQRVPCPPRRPAPARLRPLCGLTKRTAGFARRVTLRAARRRVLSVRRGKGGYWQGYSARPSAYSARPNPARRGFCPPPVFACAPREGRILEVSQRVPCPPRRPAPARVPCAAYPCLPPVFSCARPSASSARPYPARRGFCPPRHPARRRPRPPHSPIPPCRGFCPSAAGRTDIGREPARTVPAASPCAPARVLRAA